ncbi:hypothetical protein [Sphingomonas asaccharolytica]|uniref:hypothetical protein n=1 Tax=Sphingomonas asaccharolytica TaxID=40681 RepID=UPI00083605DB|nr:hypothetical protein [Sphingomonas asaccharolytica]
MGVLTRTLAGAAFLAVATAASTASSRPVSDSDIASGDYGGEMLIAVDPASHVVRGYYQSSTGNGRFNCIFYFSGKVNGAIRSYFPETPDEVVMGTLSRESDGSLSVRLATEHGGCWNVQHFADKDQPAEFTLQTAYPWVSVAVIKRARAHLYDSPISKAPRKAYVVKGGGVGIRASRPGWIQVDFLGGGKAVSGWIRSSDVYPLS